MNCRKLINIFLFIIGVTAFFACKKDLSTLDLNKIKGVTLDTTGTGILNVLQFEHLVLKPKVITGIDPQNLAYEWRINSSPSDTIYLKLSNTKDLDAEISFTPTRSGAYHQLVYTITDKSNGLKYMTSWKVAVKNSIGEGLVVAETSDGINTDLSHIMHPLVTREFTGESVKHNIYSGINGSTIPGIVKQMRFNSDILGLFGITDNSIFKVNTLDYKLGGKNEELFFSHAGAFAPQSLGALYQSDVYIENGKMYANYMAVAKKWGVPLDSKFNVPGIVALNGYDNLTSDLETVLNFYDEINGKFVYLMTVGNFGDRNMYAYPSNPAQVFNPGNLPGKINVAASIGVDEDYVHLLKDKVSGKLSLYAFAKAIDNYPDPLTPPSPKAVYDLSNAPEIGEAIKFVLYNGQRVMYYATSKKIYVVLFGGASPIFEERYTVPAGEQITTLQMFQQSDYPYSYGPFISTNNNQLILSTYSGTEGKVHILPIKSVGSGTLDLPNIKTFTGFGKITAITSQK
ncbi:PKD-like family lipoprotein [Pedobacter nyackensis]|uniref:PKD-like family lipoprotein n=1 Tax=Pedobacter nyackensis TaxID=475255 RepID=UPI0029316EFE|nr:PKD-like family lipoprotein [Pedobacter nyackensis]